MMMMMMKMKIVKRKGKKMLTMKMKKTRHNGMREMRCDAVGYMYCENTQFLIV